MRGTQFFFMKIPQRKMQKPHRYFYSIGEMWKQKEISFRFLGTN